MTLSINAPPLCTSPVQPQCSSLAPAGLLVEVSPQGNLGRGEACVIGQGVAGLPLPGPGGRGNDVLIMRGGQVVRDEFRFAPPVEPVAPVHGQLRAQPVEGRQGQLGHLHVEAGGLQVQAGGPLAPVVGRQGVLTGAVRLELQQLLLALALLQLHNADLKTPKEGTTEKVD